MIELIEGFWVDVWEVRAVKKIDEGKCSIFLSGMGAMDGFVVDYSAEEVVQAIIDEREKGDDDDEDQDEEETT